jgi:hypothetical protein
MAERQKAMVDGNEAAASVAHRAPPDTPCTVGADARTILAGSASREFHQRPEVLQ